MTISRLDDERKLQFEVWAVYTAHTSKSIAPKFFKLENIGLNKIFEKKSKKKYFIL